MGELTGLVGVLIPIFALSIPMVAIWAKHRQKIAEMELRATAEKAALYATSNTELEARLRVLERIVTDKGYDVATQIEALRDARKVDALLDDRTAEPRR